MRTCPNPGPPSQCDLRRLVNFHGQQRTRSGPSTTKTPRAFYRSNQHTTTRILSFLSINQHTTINPQLSSFFSFSPRQRGRTRTTDASPEQRTLYRIRSEPEQQTFYRWCQERLDYHRPIKLRHHLRPGSRALSSGDTLARAAQAPPARAERVALNGATVVYRSGLHFRQLLKSRNTSLSRIRPSEVHLYTDNFKHCPCAPTALSTSLFIVGVQALVAHSLLDETKTLINTAKVPGIHEQMGAPLLSGLTISLQRERHGGVRARAGGDNFSSDVVLPGIDKQVKLEK